MLTSNPRLLVPVGTMIARGPTLPLGCDSLILEYLADDLSARLGIPTAPVIPFGVHSRRDPEVPGSAGLTRKTLHRLMNELIERWESEAKIREIFVLTAHAADAHLEALSAIRALGRLTLIDIYTARLPDDLRSLPLDATLLQLVAPNLIRPAFTSPVSINEPTAAHRLYQTIRDHVADRIERAGSADPTK